MACPKGYHIAKMLVARAKIMQVELIMSYVERCILSRMLLSKPLYMALALKEPRSTARINHVHCAQRC